MNMGLIYPQEKSELEGSQFIHFATAVPSSSPLRCHLRGVQAVGILGSNAICVDRLEPGANQHAFSLPDRLKVHNGLL